MQTVLETRSKLIWCVGRSVLDVLLPPQCLACDTSVDQPGSLCAACFSQFTFITRPYCNLYCLPFESAVIEDEVMCGACMKDHPAFNRARAVFSYRDSRRTLVLKLKHADRTDAGAHLSGWMKRAGAAIS